MRDDCRASQRFDATLDPVLAPRADGLTRANLFRMRQFHDMYRHDTKVASLVRRLPWTQSKFSAE